MSCSASTSPLPKAPPVDAILVMRSNMSSGGSGKHKGGDGLRFEVEVTADTPMMASMIMTRYKTAPQGIRGGEPGKVGGLYLNGKAINPADHWVLNMGDRVVMETAGGGGCGLPISQ